MNQNLHKIVGYALILTMSSLLTACDKASAGTSNVELYGSAIGGLADDEAFAIVDAGAENPVLLASNQLIDNGQTAAFCDVYYAADGEAKKIGAVDDPETTAPLTCDASGIYAAGELQVLRYEVREEGGLELSEAVYIRYDETGHETFEKTTDGRTEQITEEEFLALSEKAQKAELILFHYGASGS